ncbi:MAG: hypothetical protein U0N63_05240 [Senegalimassilia anaerobia]|uniref:hypothetical protein n=1 Tax=Senegalimassilia anaerobia TaxID=1473216 RepID=UPI002F94D3B4
MTLSKPSDSSPPLCFPMHALRSVQVIIRSFSVSKLENYLSFETEGQYAHGCVEERIPVAPCRQRFELLGKPNARIAELNDGPFVVDDQETPRVEAL